MKFQLGATKERKYILIAGLLLLVVAAVYRFYPDLRTLLSVDTEIAQRQRRLAKYQAMVEERKVLEERIASAERVLKRIEVQLIDRNTPALAAAEVQNILNSIVASKQADIKTMRVLKIEDTKIPGYVGIPVQITLSCTTRQLMEVLYGIETGRKMLSVEDMRIRYQRRGRQASGIQATLTVMGVMKSESK